MQCLGIIKQNVTLSLVSKVAMIVLAILGYGPLWLAVIADVGAMLIVCLNGMRLLKADVESAVGGYVCDDSVPAGVQP